MADQSPISNGLRLNGRHRLGPHSKAIDRGAVGWSINGRSREGRFLRAYERMLVQHVGGKPSCVQAELIRRSARLALHLELQDDLTLRTGEMSDHASRQYLAWHGALTRTLRMLGLEGSKQQAQSLVDYLARKAAGAPQREPHTASDTSPQHSTTPASAPALARPGEP